MQLYNSLILNLQFIATAVQCVLEIHCHCHLTHRRFLYSWISIQNTGRELEVKIMTFIWLFFDYICNKYCGRSSHIDFSWFNLQRLFEWLQHLDQTLFKLWRLQKHMEKETSINEMALDGGQKHRYKTYYQHIMKKKIFIIIICSIWRKCVTTQKNLEMWENLFEYVLLERKCLLLKNKLNRQKETLLLLCMLHDCWVTFGYDKDFLLTRLVIPSLSTTQSSFSASLLTSKCVKKNQLKLIETYHKQTLYTL